ncbi:MAG: hypothetical protein WAW85_16165 [Gordonia sp. (in: high G+C Gram-positive bacteria)]|uniref:hypothetical protein n=1 Tax=Gordonia sp. (in: high G+C Gram-positive bacteria) TaxID=84139 RepID=UPI003BB572C1
MSENVACDAVERLQRWADSGAYFAIVSRHRDQLTLALLTCSGGEEMGRITSADPAVAAWCANNDGARAEGY